MSKTKTVMTHPVLHEQSEQCFLLVLHLYLLYFCGQYVIMKCLLSVSCCVLSYVLFCFACTCMKILRWFVIDLILKQCILRWVWICYLFQSKSFNMVANFTLFQHNTVLFVKMSLILSSLKSWPIVFVYDWFSGSDPRPEYRRPTARDLEDKNQGPWAAIVHRGSRQLPHTGDLFCPLLIYSTSPWYNRHGWLGVKNHLSILYSTLVHRSRVMSATSYRWPLLSIAHTAHWSIVRGDFGQVWLAKACSDK